MSAVGVGIVMIQGAGIFVDAVNASVDGAVDVKFVHDGAIDAASSASAAASWDATDAATTRRQ